MEIPPSLNNSVGRQHSLLSPLDCLPAKAGGAVNGGAYGETAKTITYYREDGTPLPELTKLAPRWYDRVSVVGGMIEVLELQTASYYDLETMQCRFRTSLHYLPE